MERSQAAEWLVTAEIAGRRARTARRASWIPLAVLGVITLGAMPLYRFPTASGSGEIVIRGVRSFGPLSWFAGGFFLRNPAAVSLYWLIALPVGYVATALVYRLRAGRRGVGGTRWQYVVTGVALFGVLILSAVLGRTQPGDLFIRGLTPLIPIAAGLFVLAAVERSLPLLAFAVAFLGLTLTVNLYDVENLFARIGVSVPTPAIGLILPGAMLLGGAMGFWLAGRRTA